MWVNVEWYKDNPFPYQERLYFAYGITSALVITPFLLFYPLVRSHVILNHVYKVHPLLSISSIVVLENPLKKVSYDT